MAAKAGTKAGRKPGGTKARGTKGPSALDVMAAHNAAGEAHDAALSTSPVSLTPNEQLLLGKAMQSDGKKHEEKARKRGAELVAGPYTLDVEQRLILSATVAAPFEGTEGTRQNVATVHPLDLLIGYFADECGADMTQIDRLADDLMKRRKKVLATKSGEALLANVAEVLVAKVDEAAHRNGFFHEQTVGAQPAKAGAVRCEVALEVKKVRRA